MKDAPRDKISKILESFNGKASLSFNKVALQIEHQSKEVSKYYDFSSKLSQVVKDSCIDLMKAYSQESNNWNTLKVGDEMYLVFNLDKEGSAINSALPRHNEYALSIFNSLQEKVDDLYCEIMYSDKEFPLMSDNRNDPFLKDDNIHLIVWSIIALADSLCSITEELDSQQGEIVVWYYNEEAIDLMSYFKAYCKEIMV